jgi:hypothetical protein
MTTTEDFQISFFITFWFFIFQVAGTLLYFSTKKALRQYQTARRMKSGQARCRAYFHCHCEKIGQHTKHVNETNMVVWE